MGRENPRKGLWDYFLGNISQCELLLTRWKTLQINEGFRILCLLYRPVLHYVTAVILVFPEWIFSPTKTKARAKTRKKILFWNTGIAAVKTLHTWMVLRKKRKNENETKNKQTDRYGVSLASVLFRRRAAKPRGQILANKQQVCSRYAWGSVRGRENETNRGQGNSPLLHRLPFHPFPPSYSCYTGSRIRADGSQFEHSPFSLRLSHYR